MTPGPACLALPGACDADSASAQATEVVTGNSGEEPDLT